MKKEIIDIDKAKGIFRVTTSDERWYVLPAQSPETGLPEYRFLPSVTWIAGHYPKGIGFYKWLADKGWDEAEAIKSAAGDKGSKVHQAIEFLSKGGLVKHDSRFENKDTGQMEELKVEEYEAILSFADFWKELNEKHKVEVLLTEKLVVSKEYGYAGMLDIVLRVDDEIWILDNKISQYVWTEYELQVSAYRQALQEVYKSEVGLPIMNLIDAKLFILQLGYRRNQRLWKLNEVEDKFDLFLTARKIWANENKDVKPKQKDYPLEIKLTKEEQKNADQPKTAKVRKARV